MDSQQKVGLVTVTFNSGRVIEDFLDSLLKQSYDNYSLYIIDNCSKDDTLKCLEPYLSDPRIVLIKNKDNIGVAAGNNQGIIRALEDRCDSILLINNDTEFEPALVDTLVQAMQNLKCDLIVPKILYHDEPQRIWFAGGRFLPWKAYQNVHEGDGEIDKGQYDQVRKIDYSPTCCMLITRETFASIGIMDEKYFVYYDDTDFCLRALRAGLTMYIFPAARLTHKVSSLTGGKVSDFGMHYLTRNFVYYVRKNIGMPLAVFWLLMIQINLHRRLLLRIDAFHGYKIKQKAFWCGIKL